MIYEIGDIARLLFNNIKDVSGSPADPTTVVLLVMAPDNTQTTYSGGQIVHDSVGNFHCDVPVTLSGIYNYRWTGSGAVLVVLEGSFTSSQTILAPVPVPLLVTIDQVKNYLYPAVSTTTDDGKIQSLIAGASQYIINFTRRGTDLYSSRNFSERYDGNNQDFLRTRHWPITAVSLLQVNNITVVATPDFIAPGYAVDGDPEAGKILLITNNGNSAAGINFYWRNYGGLFFYKGRMNVLVNYTAGYGTVPFDLQDACVRIVAQNYKRRGTIDEKSKALAQGAGTQSYRDWEVDPLSMRTMRYYQRQSL